MMIKLLMLNQENNANSDQENSNDKAKKNKVLLILHKINNHQLLISVLLHLYQLNQFSLRK